LVYSKGYWVIKRLGIGGIFLEELPYWKFFKTYILFYYFNLGLGRFPIGFPGK